MDRSGTWAGPTPTIRVGSNSKKNLPNVKTTYQESVPENPADAERAIRQIAQKGNKVIFTTSFGYMDPTINVAKDFPDTVFVHISGYKTAETSPPHSARSKSRATSPAGSRARWQPTGKLGYVAAFPIPEVIRGINAFTLGVRKANPAATVKVVWTNTWYDPPTERQAAEALLDGGADVIAQHQDTAGPAQAARGARHVRRRLRLGSDRHRAQGDPDQPDLALGRLLH